MICLIAANPAHAQKSDQEDAVLSATPPASSEVTSANAEEAAAIWLFDASRSGNADILRDLIAAGIDVNGSDPEGWTPLMFAADAGKTAAVRALLDGGADPNAKSRSGVSALFLAAVGNKPEAADIVAALAAAGADPNASTGSGLTPLLAAVIRGDAAMVERLVRHGANPNIAGGNKITPLLAALTRSDTNAGAAVFKRLLELGADPNATGEKGQTLLMLAAHNGDLASVKMLVDHGADVGARTVNGLTAFDIAKAQKKSEIADALSRASAADKTPRPSPAALIAAVIAKNGPAVREQIRLGADANAVDASSGWTPLMFAAQAGDPAIIESILAADAKVNYADKKGVTALHVAALSGRTKVVERLLEAGADRSAATVDGATLVTIMDARRQLSDIKKRIVTMTDRCSNSLLSWRETGRFTHIEHSMGIILKIEFDENDHIITEENTYKHTSYNHSRRKGWSWDDPGFSRMRAKLADIDPTIRFHTHRNRRYRVNTAIGLKCSKPSCFPYSYRFNKPQDDKKQSGTNRTDNWMIAFCNVKTARQVANELSRLIRMSGGRR